MAEPRFVVEQRATGNENVRPGPRRTGDGLRRDAAIYFQIDGVVQTGVRNHGAHSANLCFHRCDVRLTTEAGVHRHHEYEVDEIKYVRNLVGRSRRVQRHRCSRPQLADVTERAMQMVARLDVHDQPLAASLDVSLGHHVGGHHHEVGLERFLREVSSRCDDVGAEREIGDELPVHHVPLNEIGTCRIERDDCFAEFGEVDRQHRRSDLHGPHASSSLGSLVVTDAEPTARVGATQSLRIERLVAGGEAMARRADGRVVFVAGALPGEMIDVEYVEVKRDFARARVMKIVESSSHRVTPPCRHVSDGCGGCDWQHIATSAQHDAKVAVVREAFARTGRLSDVAIRRGGSVGYDALRTTVRMAVSPAGRLGFRRAASHDVVDIDTCLVTHPRIAEIVSTVGVRGGGEVTLRCGDATGERAVWSHDKARLLGLPEDVATGANAVVHEEVAGTRLQVSMESFFQASRQAAELLVDSVARASHGALDGADGVVVDAYGGVGLFAATVVPVGVPTVVVEASDSACEDARVNLRGHGARVVRARFEHWSPQRAGLVIADPARSGLGKPGVSVVVGTAAPRVVLVSCDAVAAARDARLLVDSGYSIVEIEVLDLFPHTHHVEVVTSFERP